jgi:hypothetical protein
MVAIAALTAGLLDTVTKNLAPSLLGALITVPA